jgi:hypothetical protein
VAWVFVSEAGTPLDGSNVRKAMTRILKKAKLPPHFTPHCLRHTYASLMLQQGGPVAYVQRQLGHASIQLTVDTDGKWLPMESQAALDRLDSPMPQSGSKMVANAKGESRKSWSWREELNLQPAVYKTAALPLSYASHEIELSGEFRPAEGQQFTKASTSCPPKAHTGIVMESFSRPCCCDAQHRALPLSRRGQINRLETIARRRNVLQIPAGIERAGTHARMSRCRIL